MRSPLLFLLLFSAFVWAKGDVYQASEHGIKGDGILVETQALQKLVDTCAAEGGGTVILDKGTIVSGMIVLKNGVTLNLAEGVTLKNTGKKEDYPFVSVDILTYYPKRRTMIYAQNQQGIAVTGKGTIDGGSSSYKARSSESDRVSLIRFDGCQGVEVKDITLTNASMWTQHFFCCDNLFVTGIKVKNYMKNDDGLNIDGCHGVRVDRCDISTHDDAITLKNTGHRESRDVTVSNCKLKSVKSAFKFGTESYDGFVNVTARNLTIEGGRDALAFFSVDGAKIENVLIENITIIDSKCPLIVFLGRRLRKIGGDSKQLTIGSVNKMMVKNLKATGCSKGIILAGMKGNEVKDITLDGVDVHFKPEPPKAAKKKNKKSRKNKKKKSATGDTPTRQADLIVKVQETGYPSSSLFGTLNAWGLFVRHAEGIVLNNVNLTLDGDSTAHKAYFEDVRALDIPSDLKVQAEIRQ
ncbi:MAG: right-handed parallel beta-helix repeat-containing protein [Planctomycetes bacterium]|nr:right-handed parallel beta-helix repeat-containing protein [Planctomycetota bacterium]